MEEKISYLSVIPQRRGDIVTSKKGAIENPIHLQGITLRLPIIQNCCLESSVARNQNTGVVLFRKKEGNLWRIRAREDFLARSDCAFRAMIFHIPAPKVAYHDRSFGAARFNE